MKKPLIIGLTGSIGMGKSTVAAMFADEGIAVFCADASVHEMQAPGGELVKEIEAAFPGTTSENGVDRRALGAIVLGNKELVAKLESIIHPAVARKRAQFLEQNSQADLIVFDIPLLFEKGGEAAVDVIVVVSASASEQSERVMSRPGMTADRFKNILALQMNDADKRARAHHVIDTGRSIPETREQVRQLVKSLRAGLA